MYNHKIENEIDEFFEYESYCQPFEYEISLDEMLDKIRKEKTRSLSLEDLDMSWKDFM